MSSSLLSSLTHPQRIVEVLLVLLVGLSALFGTLAVNSCLDPTDADYSCVLSSLGYVYLVGCGITDEDLDDLATCLDDAGREDIILLNLGSSALTTLPEGVFEGLTALETLTVYNNTLTTLPEGVFGGLTALGNLWLFGNSLTTLPEGIFEDLTALTRLRLEGNALECLPIIPSALVEVDDDATQFEDGLHVDPYGAECGCSIPDVTDNVCGQETCTPGPEGYTCGAAAFPAPTPALSVAAASAAPTPALLVAAASPAPTPAPYFGTTLTPTTAPGSSLLKQQSSSDSTSSDFTPIVAGVVSAVAGTVLIALAFFLKRRRASKQKNTHQFPAVVSTRDDGSLEQGRAQPPDARPPSSAGLAVGDENNQSPLTHNASPHRHTPVEADNDDGEGIVPPSTPASIGGQVQSSAEQAKDAPTAAADAAKDRGTWLAGDDAAGGSTEKSSTATTSIATASTANMSTAERDEVAQFHQRQRAADAAPIAGGPKPEEASGGGPGVSSEAGRQTSAGDIGLGNAVLAAAQELSRSCQIPGVSEAAAAVCIIANMVADSRENDRASESRLRRCHTIVMALKRAAKVAEKGGNTIGEVARFLIQEVHEAIFDLVELIKTFRSKNKLSRLFMSTLFKRRQDELDAVVDRAIMRLQLGLQLHVGQDVSVVKDDVSAVKDSLRSAKEDIKDSLKSIKEGMHLYQRSISEAALESVAEARSIKRRRKLDQIEIPEEHLSMTDELLGKGGFGEVYLADYNGHNAAVKVLYIAHDVGPLDGNQRGRETSQRRAFLRELEAMIRLRSDNTVNVHGAVTSLPDRMMLVMELLAGGDLLALLRESKEPLPEEQSRRIIRDICTGMAFLHSKNTVHGDLKSANVLLDGDGRAKIADFGTSRWTQHTNSISLATYTTRSSQTTQMSIAWSAPEVLDSEGSSYASDVYSFGIVVWEVISRKLPWSNKIRISEIALAVLKGIRPSFHVDAPVDIVDIAKACWCGVPKERATFRDILEGIKAKGG